MAEQIVEPSTAASPQVEDHKRKLEDLEAEDTLTPLDPNDKSDFVDAEETEDVNGNVEDADVPFSKKARLEDTTADTPSAPENGFHPEEESEICADACEGHIQDDIPGADDKPSTEDSDKKNDEDSSTSNLEKISIQDELPTAETDELPSPEVKPESEVLPERCIEVTDGSCKLESEDVEEFRTEVSVVTSVVPFAEADTAEPLQCSLNDGNVQELTEKGHLAQDQPDQIPSDHLEEKFAHETHVDGAEEPQPEYPDNVMEDISGKQMQDAFGEEDIRESHSSGLQTALLRVEVPNDKVGVLIGKGGETIRYLQHSSGAKIQITRDLEADLYSTMRPVELIGTPESVVKAEKLIKDVITEAEAGGSPSLIARGYMNSRSANTHDQIQMQISNDKVGMIIGKGGDTIKSLQARSGTRIQLIPQQFSDGEPSRERTVKITGEKKQIEIAKEMIKELMSQPSRPPSHGSSGGYGQQSYRSRPQQQWGPRGDHSYDSQQRSAYPSGGGYGNYPPVQQYSSSSSSSRAHTWDQRGHSGAPSGNAYGYFHGPGGQAGGGQYHGSGPVMSQPGSGYYRQHQPGAAAEYGGHPSGLQGYGGYEDPRYAQQRPYGIAPQQTYGQGYGAPPSQFSTPSLYAAPAQQAIPPASYGLPRGSAFPASQAQPYGAAYPQPQQQHQLQPYSMYPQQQQQAYVTHQGYPSYGSAYAGQGAVDAYGQPYGQQQQAYAAAAYEQQPAAYAAAAAAAAAAYQVAAAVADPAAAYGAAAAPQQQGLYMQQPSQAVQAPAVDSTAAAAAAAAAAQPAVATAVCAKSVTASPQGYPAAHYDSAAQLYATQR